jgi:mycothiol system anti-sigma-R factor
MIDCTAVVRQLWEYLDGTVDLTDRTLVDEHLARCRRCCGERDFAVELRRLLADSRSDELPDDVRHRLSEALDDLHLVDGEERGPYENPVDGVVDVPGDTR